MVSQSEVHQFFKDAKAGPGLLKNIKAAKSIFPPGRSWMYNDPTKRNGLTIPTQRLQETFMGPPAKFTGTIYDLGTNRTLQGPLMDQMLNVTADMMRTHKDARLASRTEGIKLLSRQNFHGALMVVRIPTTDDKKLSKPLVMVTGPMVLPPPRRVQAFIRKQRPRPRGHLSRLRLAESRQARTYEAGQAVQKDRQNHAGHILPRHPGRTRDVHLRHRAKQQWRPG